MNYDEEIKNKIQLNQNKYKIFCDVGACNGYYTNFFIGIASADKIYSFEANTSKFNSLLSSDKRCIYENIAISDIDGYETLYLESGGCVEMSSIIENNGFTKNGITYNDSYKVKSCKMDTYFKDIKVDCIKIDIEGAELKAIIGGIETIKNSKFCIIECHFDHDWEEIYNLLEKNDISFNNLEDDQPIILGKRPYQIYRINND